MENDVFSERREGVVNKTDKFIVLVVVDVSGAFKKN